MKANSKHEILYQKSYENTCNESTLIYGAANHNGIQRTKYGAAEANLEKTHPRSEW